MTTNKTTGQLLSPSKPLNRVLEDVMARNHIMGVGFQMDSDRRYYDLALRDCLAAMNGERPARWPEAVWLHKWEIKAREKERKYKEAMANTAADLRRKDNA